MALTKLTTELENIQALSDTPNSTEGLTADELKALFDKAPTDIKTYLNDTLTEEVDTAISGLLNFFYPVGTIYETTSTNLDTTTKMANHFGGTWEDYGAGRVLVAKSADTEFDTIGETGGAKTHTLTEPQMPSHNHGLDASIVTFSDTKTAIATSRGSTATAYYYGATTQGGNQAHNNLQPYIVVYRYRRTA